MHLVIALIQRTGHYHGNVAAGVANNQCCGIGGRICRLYPARFTGIREDEFDCSARNSLQCADTRCDECVIRRAWHFRIDVGIVDAGGECQFRQVEVYLV